MRQSAGQSLTQELDEPSPTQSKLSQVVEPDVVWARPVGDEPSGSTSRSATWPNGRTFTIH
jgi:hypothetical protein